MPARDLRPNSLYILLSYLRPASDGYKYVSPKSTLTNHLTIIIH